ncbi:MAG: hypothetical protein J5746_10785 [Victivallales bacterium]|nr:hypothetical protein [Victivallales bacterium]
MPETVKVKCPDCGKTVAISVTNLIDAGDTVRLKELFSGSLNSGICPGCGRKVAVPCDLTYKDVNPPFILFELPRDDETPVEEIELKMDELATEIFAKANLPRPTVRITFSRADFIEKIAIRRMGFDDRLLEFAKLQLFRTVEEPQLMQSRHRLLLDYSHCTDEILAFLIYDLEDGKFVNSLHVPMEEFKSLVHSYENDREAQLELEAAFPGCYVSAEKLL